MHPCQSQVPTVQPRTKMEFSSMNLGYPEFRHNKRKPNQFFIVAFYQTSVLTILILMVLVPSEMNYSYPKRVLKETFVNDVTKKLLFTLHPDPLSSKLSNFQLPVTNVVKKLQIFIQMRDVIFECPLMLKSIFLFENPSPSSSMLNIRLILYDYT